MLHRPRIRRFAIQLLIFLVCFELFAFALVSIERKQIAPASTLFRGTLYVDNGGPRGCRWGDFVSLHPYLSIYYHRGQECSRYGVNSVGLLGRELPETRDENYFNILVLGGSVAEQFSIPVSPANEFEEILNAEYRSPNGKPFRVLNGAIAAGKQPMQMVSYFLFGHLAHAVVALEGYNEIPQTLDRFEEPSGVWQSLAAPRGIDLFAQIFRAGSQRWLRFCSERAPFRYSYAAYFTATKFFALSEEINSRFSTSRPFPPLPTAWNEVRREEYRVDRYARYVRLLSAMTSAEKQRLAFFFQPVPAVQKPLTDTEKAVAGDLGYGKSYARMANQLVKVLREEYQLPVFSLLDIFANNSSEVYVDTIHFYRGPQYQGYPLMARAMAEKLATEWKLKKTSYSGK